MNKKHTTKVRRATFLGLLFFVVLGLLLINYQTVQAALLNQYNKVNGAALQASEWNNLLNDFVTKNNSGDRLEGFYGINTATSTTYRLDISGALRATSITGALSGTLSAANVSSGAFGGNTGGGNYNFPANIGIGIGTSTPASIITLANNRWVSTLNSAGTGYVNVFKVNANDEIEIGGALNIGNFQFPADSGFNTFVDMPVTSASANDSTQGYVMKIDGDNILSVFSQSDGVGGIKNKRIGINTSTPQFDLDVNGIINASALYVNGSPYIGSQWITNGTSVYYNTGNVGIGVSNPGYKLDVLGEARISPSAVTPSLTNAGLFVGTTGSLNTYGAFEVKTAVGNFVVTNAGNVGIGTTGPGAKLHIATTASGKQKLLYLAEPLYPDASGANAYGISLYGDNVNGVFTFYGMNSGVETINPILSMKRVTGNVGIGTTTPQYKLHLSGGSAVEVLNVGGGLIGGLDLTPLDDDQAVPLGYLEANYTPSGTVPGGVGSGITGQTLRHDGTSWVGNSTLFNNGTNVGIGTTNPSQKLHVLGHAIIGDGGGAAALWLNGTAYGGIGTGTSGSTLINLTPAGNVGIGTTAPGAKLEVYSSSVSEISTNSALGVAEGSQIGIIEFNSAAQNSGLESLASINTFTRWGAPGVRGGQLRFSTRVNSGGALTERMTIEPNGNVGIGTTAPGAKLHIGAGNILLDNNQLIQSKDAVGTIRSLLTYTSGNQVILGSDVSHTTAIKSEGQTVFSTNGSMLKIDPVTAGQPMVFGTTRAGNVGIGTTTPVAKLDFNPDTIDRINVRGGQVAGLNSTPFNPDHAVPLGYLEANYTPSGTAPGGVGSGTTGQTLRHDGTSWVGNSNLFNTGTNVGVGTTNPGAKLDVQGGSIRTSNNISLGYGGLLYWGGNSGYTTIQGSGQGAADNTSYLDFRAGDAVRMRINGAGNVGIGTSAPTAKLDVSGDSKFRDVLYADTIRPLTGNQLSFLNGGSNFAYFNGSVGIGTTNPGMKLHIEGGDIALTGGRALYSFGNGGPGVANSSWGNFYSTGGTTRFLTSGSGTYASSIPNMSFDKYNGSSVTNLMTILSTTGNVGIGTTTPVAKLDFNPDTVDRINVRGGQVAGLNSTPFNPDHAVPLGYLEANYTPSGTAPGGVGSGTTGQTLRHDGTSWVGNSVLFNNGTNVGIGTTAPGAKLEIYHASTPNINFNRGGVVRGQIDVGTGYGGVSVHDLVLRSPSGAIHNIVGSTVGLTVASTGNIGIGTVSPGAKTEIYQAMSDYSTAFTSPHLNLGASNTIDSTGFVGITYDTSTAANYGWSSGALRSTSGQGDFVWKFHSSSVAGTEWMRITSTGNVGIGTTAPNEKLKVDGRASFSNNAITETILWPNVYDAGASRSVRNVILNSDDLLAYAVDRGYSVTSNRAPDSGTLKCMFWPTGSSCNKPSWNNVSPANPVIISITALPNLAVDRMIIVPSGRNSLPLDYKVETYDIYNVGNWVIRKNVVGETTPYIKYINLGTQEGVQQIIITVTNAGDSDQAGRFAVNNIVVTSRYQSGRFTGYAVSAAGDTIYGNLGIGTTTPMVKLDFASSTVDTINVRGGQVAGLASTPTNTDHAVPLGYLQNNYAPLGSGVGSAFVQGGNSFGATATLGTNDAQRLDIETNNATRMTIDSGGNVGVGTTAPGQKLHVSGNALIDSGNMLYFRDTTSYINEASGLNIVAGNTRSLNLAGGTGVDMTITNAGNVGIGTDSPQVKLDIRSNINSTAVSIWNTNAGLSAIAGIYFVNNNVNESPVIGYTSSAYTGHGGANTFIVNSSNRDFAVVNGSREVARFTNAGNVGIGTTTPGYKLDVLSGGTSTYFSGFRASTGSSEFKIYQASTNNNVLYGLNTAGTVNINLHTGGFSYIKGGTFQVGGSADNGNTFQVIGTSTFSGNVGIGTTTPMVKLDFASSTVDTINVRGGQVAGLASTPTNTDHAVPLGYLQNNYAPLGSGVGSAFVQGGNSFGATATLGTNDAQRLDIETNNATRMTIDSGGSVGIGTTTPGYKLDIIGEARANNLRIANTTNGGLIDVSGTAWIYPRNTSNNLHIRTASGGIYIDTDNDVNFRKTDGTGLVKILSTSGNVGIGTSAPKQKLHVQGNLVLSSGSQDIGWANGEVLQIGQWNADYSAYTERMRIDISGNVGIGTTTPIVKLDFASSTVDTINVRGGQVAGLASTPTNTDHAVPLGYLQNNYAPLGSGVGSAFVQGGNSFGATAILGTNDAQRLDIETSNATRMTIASGGNVGIGTTNPSSKFVLTDIGPATDYDSLVVNFQANGTYNGLNTSAGRFVNTLALSSQSNAVGVIGEAVKTGSYGSLAKGVSGRGIFRSDVARTSLSALNLYGVEGQVSVEGAGVNTVNSGKAIYATANVVAGNTLSTYHGVYVGTPSGTITNKYALVTEPNAGNVGIGTTAPTSKLDIIGSVADASLSANSAATANFRTTGHVQMAISTQAASPYTTSLQGKHSTADGAAYPLALNPLGGNVGIGYTNPGEALAVNGNLVVGGTSSSGYKMVVYGSTYIAGTTNYIDGVTIFRTPSAVLEAMRITSTGNVGIGTTNPTTKLYVNGGTGDVVNVGGGRIRNLNTTPINADEAVPLIYLQNNYAPSGATTLWSGTKNGNIWNGDAGAGNVGIGTTAPGAKLEVNGTAKIGGITFNDSVKNDDSIYFSPQSYIEAGVLPPSFNVNIPGVVSFVTDTNTTIPYSKVMLFSGYTEGQISDFIPVQAGEKLYTEVWAKTGAGTPGGFYIGVSQYDKDKRIINGNVGLQYFTSLTIPANTDWQKITGSYTLPTTHTPYNGSDGGAVRYVRYYIIVNYSGGTTPLYLSGLVLRRQVLFRDSGPAVFNGNVGIGTTNPVNLLNIKSSFPQFNIETSSVAARGAINFVTSGGNAWRLGSYITIAEDGNFEIVEGSTSRIYIKPGGNVGIGTTNPGAYKLYVNGDTNINGTLTATSFVGPVTGTLNAVNVSSGAFGANTGGGNYSFSGNVGIGTTTPVAKLELLSTSEQLRLDYNASNYVSFTTDSGGNLRITPTGYAIKSGSAGVPKRIELNDHFKIYQTGADSSVENVINQDAHFIGSTASTNSAHYTLNLGQKPGTGHIQTGGEAGNVRIVGDFLAPAASSGSFSSLFISGTINPNATATGVARGLYISQTLTQLPTGGYRAIDIPTNNASAYGMYQSGASTRNYFAGNVGIGTTNPGVYRLKVAGDVAITGTLQTQTGSDFAEEFSVLSDLSAGTVVVMDDQGYKSVKASDKPYDQTVVGIVSDNPSIIAGRIESEQKVVVAMMGVVSVKVSDINGTVKKGDLLTSSAISGYAMKALDYRPGTVLGKALEDLEGNRGSIKVLVNLQ